MPDPAKVVVNLATGLDDGERVTVALLVGGAALEQGRQVSMFLTKEAVRLALPGYAEAIMKQLAAELKLGYEKITASEGKQLSDPSADSR